MAGRTLRLVLVALVLLVALAPAPAAAQTQDQVTELTILQPPPAMFNATTPFRTNKTIIRIGFSHNGNSGSYFINSDGADVDGSTFLPQPTDKTGEVLAGFLAEGLKTINLVLLQTRINVVAQTNTPVVVAFDITPPTMILQSIRVGGMGGMGGQVLGLQGPMAPGGMAQPNQTDPRIFTVAGASNPFRTRADQLEIAAAATDTFTPLAEIQATSSVPEAGTIPEAQVAQVAGQPGSFRATYALAGVPDGELSLTLRPNDQVHNALTNALERGNVGPPHVVRIIRDTTPPRVTNIQIIRPLQGMTDQCNKPAATTTTGLNTFVGNETVGIKLTFSEPISTPVVRVTQQGGTPVPLTPTTVVAGRATEITFAFSPIPTPSLNGAAVLEIGGRNIGTNGDADPGVGTDEAGNGITAADNSFVTINDFLVVDTIAPELQRETAPPQRPLTIPLDGSVLNGDQLINNQIVKGSFPETIQAQLIDRPFTGRPNSEASGVDFSQIVGLGPSNPTSGALNIQLRGPNGPIPDAGVQPVILGLPPSTLQLQLGAADPALDGNPNFVRDVNDGILRPREGTYTITYNLIDRVCNTRQQTTTFRVDTTPIRESELFVTLGTTQIQRKGFCVPADPTGDPAQTFPDITVRSTAADFSTTRSNFEVLACINGVDSPCYPTVLTTFTREPTRGTISARVLGIEKVDPTGVDFPRPTTGVPNGGNGGGFLPPNTFDPRVGKFDGVYIIRLFPVDAPGNRGVLTTDGRRVDSIDFDVNLDTIKPFTERTFPRDGQFINGPLRFVDATIVDPPAKRTPRTETLGDPGNPTNVSKFAFVPGCGIDINRTQMALRLETAYQPNRVPRDLIVGAPASGPIPAGQIRGTLRFIHIPNGFDPTLPSFNENDDRFKVLLEITDRNRNVRTLPTDGSMDGGYSIGVNPVDRAGLALLPPTTILGSATPQRRGNYFGIENTEETTISITGFTFLYDNAAPRLDVNNFPENTRIGSFEFHQGPLVIPSQQALVRPDDTSPTVASDAQVVSSQQALNSQNFQAGPTITQRRFRITGATQDLSNKSEVFGSTGDALTGGAGIARVEYQMSLVDRNFQIITPPSPCASPTVNPDGSVVRACLNPILSLRNARIETFPQSVDPVPSTSDPIKPPGAGPSDFVQVRRPEHRFTIEDTLPETDLIPRPRPSPEDDFYLFIIRSVDRAGNQTELARRVGIGSIAGPALISPPDECCINSSVVEFKWSPVSTIRSYVVTVTQPNGVGDVSLNVTVAPGATPRTLFSPSREGVYAWRVSARESGGALSAPSATRTFRIDRTPPRLTNIVITGDVAPATRTGVLTIGDVLFTVEFDEPIANAPALTFDPIGESVGPQPTTTERFVSNTVVYRGNIPATAKPSEWDGIAAVNIKGVFDLCGNHLTEQPGKTFEIDTGPAFDTRFFFNPVATQEIVVVAVSTEELKLPPRFTLLQGLQQLANQAFPFQRSPRAHYTSFTLDRPNIASEVSFTLSGEDLDGNTARRPISFTVSPLTSATATSALSVDRRLSVQVPHGAVGGLTPLYVLPPSDPTKYQIARTVHRLFPTQIQSSRSQAVLAGMDAKPVAEQGLKVISYLNELGPAGVTLAKNAKVTSQLAPGVKVPDGVTPQQLGMYVWTGSRWEWAGSSVDGRTLVGQLRHLGPLAAAIDQAPPAITGLSVKDGDELESSQPVITAQIADRGAGVSQAGIQVLVDDKPEAFRFREDSGELTFTPAKPLATGKHTLALVVKDRAGNATQQAKLTVSAPAPFGLRECIAYPSPARTFTRIRLNLTQYASTARVAVDIYDVAGKRLRRLGAEGPFTRAILDLEWDLQTDEGHGVANGVYLFRATVTSTTGQTVKARGKLAVMR